MSIAANLHTIYQSIIDAEAHFARPAGSVKLLAVSKMQSVSAIREAWLAGQRDFGENYLQEALSKINTLKDNDINWHFIGALQSNKLKAIAENFQWVHSLADIKHAELLNAYRSADLPVLNVCIQVNIDNEASKAGVTLKELPALAQAIHQLPHLKLRGLMAIPKPCETFALQREPFNQLSLALKKLNTQGMCLDTLSMGMSDDFIAAIAEGATIIRLGTAIFGARI